MRGSSFPDLCSLDERAERVLNYIQGKGSLHFLLLTAILFLGALLRLHNLDGFPVWYVDEGAWSMLGKNIFLGNFRQNPQATLSKYPLFSFLVGLSLLCGNDMFHARLVPATLGIVTIIVIYLLGNELYGSSCGLLAAFCHSINLFAIYYERSVFLDVGVEFFLLLSTFLLYKWIQKPSRTMGLLTAISVGLGVMCKTPAISMVVVVVSILLVFKQGRKKVLTFTLEACLIPLIWYIFIFFSDPTDFAKEALIRANANHYWGFSLQRLLESLVWLLQRYNLLGNFMLFGCISMGYLLGRIEKKDLFIVLPIVAEISFFVILLNINDYYMISLAGFFSLASARFLMDIINKEEYQIFGWILMVLLIFIPMIPSLPLVTTEVTLILLVSCFLILTLFKLRVKPRAKPYNLTRIVTLISILLVSAMVLHSNYIIVSSDRGFGTYWEENTSDQKEVVSYINSHVDDEDVVYAASFFVFQLKCQTRDNGFSDVMSIRQAKYVVVDPSWRVFDENPFYAMDIGAAREWIISHYYVVKSIGAYDIYFNLSFTKVVEAENGSEVQRIDPWDLVLEPYDSAGAMTQSLTKNASLSFKFMGKSVALIVITKPDGGIGEVKIDGKSYGYIDFYSSTYKQRVYMPLHSNLELEEHLIQITVTGLKSTKSSGYWVPIDAFVVAGNP